MAPAADVCGRIRRSPEGNFLRGIFVANWGFTEQPMAAEWKMKNGKWKMIVCALRTILNHFRRKYHNFQFSTFNFQFPNSPLNWNLTNTRKTNLSQNLL
jgi:hypothetical protein